jgi:NF-X1-type zinc finger protein NFXL1
MGMQLSGSLNLTGSHNVSGSTTQIGNNTLIGNTVLSGSIEVSGSQLFIGTQTLSGSLSVSGSTTFEGTHLLTGTNTIIGNTQLSGSIEVSGSSNFRNSIFIVTGSQFYTGSSDFNGNQTITGSLNVTGNIDVASGSGFFYEGNKLFNRGQFYHTATLSGSSNTAYPFQYNTTDTSVTNGTVYVDNNSRIYVKHSGIYNVQFSAQLHTTANESVDFSVWFSMTGSNADNSNTDYSIEKIAGGGYAVAALNYLTHIQSGSYIELYYSKTTANGQIQAKGTQSTPTRPATPSVILTVTQVA